MGLICRLFGHKYNEDAVCIRCGTTRGSEGLKFKKTADKQSYVVVSAKKCTSDVVTIPKQYKKRPVIEIGEGAFAHRETPFRVVLHEAIRHVGKNAFRASALCDLDYGGAHCTLDEGVFDGCANLTRAPLPDGITHIPAGAFAKCLALTEISLPDSVVSVGDYAFSGCTALQRFDYANAALTLGKGALGKCALLPAVRLPETMTELPAYILAGCVSLSELTIPKGVKVIGEGALAGCTGLSAIELPEALTAIGAMAMCDCSGIETIEFPASLTDFIPNDTGVGDVFRGCTALRKVTMHTGFQHFPTGMFADCSSLSDIHLTGGKSLDWRNIQKDDGWDDGSGTYIVHLVNGRIRKGS